MEDGRLMKDKKNKKKRINTNTIRENKKKSKVEMGGVLMLAKGFRDKSGINKSKAVLTNFLNFAKSEHRSLVASGESRRMELRRKIFHLIGFIFPFIALFGEQKIVLLCVALFTLPFVVIDYNNWFLFIKKIPRGTMLTQLLRQHELTHGQLCGMSWLFIGFMITYSSCDKYIVSLGASILIVCDACASIVGCSCGRIKLCGKTLEGYIAFILSGLAVVAVYVNYIFPVHTIQFNVLFLVISLFVAATTELVSKNIIIDDNFAIQVSFCFTYRILSILFA